MLLIAPLLHAASPFSQFVPEQRLEKLLTGEASFIGIEADTGFSFMPSIASRDQIIADVRGMKPSFGEEMLRIIGGLSEPVDTPSGWLRLYNTLHSVSTMQGIPYWSETRKKTMILFLQSYAISSIEKRTRIPDPTFSAVPVEDEMLTFQEDSSFGRNTYREHFTVHGDHLVMRMENLTTISFLLLPYITSGNLVSHVVLVPSGKQILFYGITCLRTGMPYGDPYMREISLKNRLAALFDWLSKQLAASSTQERGD